MNEHFDNHFSNKVRDSFSELEVEFNEQHWHSFLLKEKKVGGVIPIFYRKALSYAAVFLVMIGVIFSFNLLLKEPKIMEPSSSQNQITDNKQSDQNITPNISEDEGVPENDSSVSEKSLAVEIDEPVAVADDAFNEENDGIVTENDISPNTYITYADVKQIILNIDEKEPTLTADINERKELLAYQEKATEPVFDIPENGSKRVNTIEFHASSLTNYSEADPSSSLNYAGGISSEIELINRVGFSGGLTIAKQSFEIRNNGIDVTTESEISETETSTFADLVTLDIPLNVRYYTKSDKNTYFSFGISSFIYLRESFITTFKQVREETVEREGIQIVSRTVQEINNIRSEKAFSRFDFAKTVNISMGFEYNVSNRLGVVFEPYAKIPIAPLTSEQVKFGSGGLHVRFQLKN